MGNAIASANAILYGRCSARLACNDQLRNTDRDINACGKSDLRNIVSTVTLCELRVKLGTRG